MIETFIFVTIYFFKRIGALHLKTFKTQGAAFPVEVRKHNDEYRLSTLHLWNYCKYVHLGPNPFGAIEYNHPDSFGVTVYTLIRN